MAGVNSSPLGEGDHRRWWRGAGLITKPRAVAPILSRWIARKIEVLPCLACPSTPLRAVPLPGTGRICA